MVSDADDAAAAPEDWLERYSFVQHLTKAQCKHENTGRSSLHVFFLPEIGCDNLTLGKQIDDRSDHVMRTELWQAGGLTCACRLNHGARKDCLGLESS